jgi:crotonobetainyl-CoA:carnitine CoA-transferase CaiB-like acyl-CoA transferase
VGGRDGADAAAGLRRAGVPAAALADSVGLVGDAHLRARGFWEGDGRGVLPGLPWRAGFGRISGAAPGLGADTDAVLRDVLGLSSAAGADQHPAGALGEFEPKNRRKLR